MPAAGTARDSRWYRDPRRPLQRSHFWPTSVQRVHCGQMGPSQLAQPTRVGRPWRTQRR